MAYSSVFYLDEDPIPGGYINCREKLFFFPSKKRARAGALKACVPQLCIGVTLAISSIGF